MKKQLTAVIYLIGERTRIDQPEFHESDPIVEFVFDSTMGEFYEELLRFNLPTSQWIKIDTKTYYWFDDWNSLKYKASLCS